MVHLTSDFGAITLRYSLDIAAMKFWSALNMILLNFADISLIMIAV